MSQTAPLQDKATFWKRRTSVVKVHMLLLAHLAREPIPEALQKDLRFVMGKCPILLEELFKVAQVGGAAPVGGRLRGVCITGWAPAGSGCVSAWASCWAWGLGMRKGVGLLVIAQLVGPAVVWQGVSRYKLAWMAW